QLKWSKNGADQFERPSISPAPSCSGLCSLLASSTIFPTAVHASLSKASSPKCSPLFSRTAPRPRDNAGWSGVWTTKLESNSSRTRTTLEGRLAGLARDSRERGRRSVPAWHVLPGFGRLVLTETNEPDHIAGQQYGQRHREALCARIVGACARG